MAWLFASGHAADIVLIVMAIEAIILVQARRLPAMAIVAAALPGALIVAALRAALIDAPWPWIALPLLAAWPAHLGDIAVRMRTARQSRTSPPSSTRR